MEQSPSAPLADEYTRVLTSLASHGVDFIVCGGVACILHGSTRNTADIDIYARLEDENLRKLVEAAKELGMRPRIPEPLEAFLDSNKRAAWITQKNAKVFTLVSPDTPLQIDVFLTYPISYDQLQSKADTATIGSLSFRFSSKQHLIQAKQMVQPPRLNDEIDIRILKELLAREQQGSRPQPE